MVIKTWEAFEPQESLLTCSPVIKQKKEDASFYIKTLRLYDNNSDLLREILTEQIAGEVPDNFFYESSTLMYNHCIYYFKRHCVDRRASA